MTTSRAFFCWVGQIEASALLSFGFFTYRSPHQGSKICQALLTSRRRSTGTTMAHSVLKSRTAHLTTGCDACLTTAAKMWQKNYVGNTARKSLARESASRQLFCCATTIMASASLNFDFFTYRSPHHGSKIWQKSSRRGAAQELFCSASDEVRALLISRRGATPVSPRSKNVAKIHVRDAARASLAQWSASRPDLLQC